MIQKIKSKIDFNNQEPIFMEIELALVNFNNNILKEQSVKITWFNNRLKEWFKKELNVHLQHIKYIWKINIAKNRQWRWMILYIIINN